MFAVIFDFDGIILDSEAPEYESHRRVFAECGVDLTIEDWCTGIGILKPQDHWFRFLCARVSDAIDFETFSARQRQYFRECLVWEPMRGVSDLIDALEENGIPRAVASTAPAGWVVHALEELGLTHRFGAIVTGDQVKRGKPAPDVYLEAARRVDVPPTACVAIEDSAPGLAAARAAGMRTVAIPHATSRSHGFDAADLLVEHAGELTLDTLRALVER